MFCAYETTVYCHQAQKMLEQIMAEAIDYYLSLHPTVFPVERQSLCIVLKAQGNYRSNGELITISVQPQSFKIVSKCIEESSRLLAWGKNRDNVISLSACLKSEAKELICSAA